MWVYAAIPKPLRIYNAPKNVPAKSLTKKRSNDGCSPKGPKKWKPENIAEAKSIETVFFPILPHWKTNPKTEANV